MFYSDLRLLLFLILVAMILSVANLLLIIWSHLPSTSCREWSFSWTVFSHLRIHNRYTESC